MNAESKWGHPETIVAIVTLIVSLIFNFLQYRTNIDIADKVDLETRKANEIQEQRDKWVSNLRLDLNKINQQILNVQGQLKITKKGTYLSDDRDSERFYTAIEENKSNLEILQKRKIELEHQINNFLSIK